MAQESGPPFRLDELRVQGPALDDDGIFAPGESVDVFTKFTPGVQWVASTNPVRLPSGSLQTSGDGDTYMTLPAATSNFNPALIGEGTENETAFRVGLNNNYQCGRQTPLRIALTNGDGEQYAPIAVPISTGGVGATKGYSGTDYGKVLADRSAISSGIEVDASGYVKRVRVTIKDFNHRFSLKWTSITLEHAGRTAVLWNRQDTPAKVMENVTFDDRSSVTPQQLAVGPDGEASTADDADGYRNVTIAPANNESLDQIFDGAPADGPWTLRVTDINSDNVLRSGGRGARGGYNPADASAVGYVGEWTLGVAEGACDPAQPQAWFGPEPLIFSPVGGQTLDASVSSDPGKAEDGDIGGIVQYRWDLDGNGSYETGPSSSSSVTLPGMALGTHTIGLQVTDVDGNVGTHQTQILIDNKPLIGTPTQSPEFPQVNQPTTLSITPTDPDSGVGGPAGTIASISWDLNGDGTFETTGGAGNTSQTLQWPTTGNKIVRVRVTDGLGASTIYVFNVFLGNRAPTAALQLTAPVSGNPVAGQTATISAAGSTDPDGTIVAYEWNLGDGYGDPVTSPTIDHVFPTRGADEVTVRVTDDGGKTDEFTLDVNVTAAPVPQMSYSPTSPAPGETITLDATGSTDADDHALTNFEWDLDGNLTFDRAGTAVLTTSYPTAGVKVINLRVTDSSGAQTLSSFAVLVSTPGPGGPGPTPPPGGGGTPGPGGGGGAATPTPKPGSTPGLGQPGGGPLPPALDPVMTPDPPAEGEINGFSAKISAGSKQRVKKVVKAGVPVALTLSAAGKASIKPMLTVKEAKKLGLKIKKTTSVGLGRATVTKAGKVKVVVKISKRFAKYVKKAKKTPISIHAVVTNADGDAVAVSRKVTLVK